MAATRVVVVDDDVPTRVGLRVILSSAADLVVVGEATNGPDAVEMAARLKPDVVLMDIQMPGFDGIEATRQITEAGDLSPNVLVLTTFDLDEYAYHALRAGACGFLLKRMPADELIDAVRAAAGGDHVGASRETRRLIARFAHPSARRRTRVFTEALTPREREILQLIVQGLSNAEIAKELFVSLDTVKTHVKHIYGKCGARDRAHAVVAAYESGLVAGQRDRLAGGAD